MKKVININFQGRVIPIEETAYDLLQRYVDSLRLFFANEEGRDEIINDIEGRIAELFGETLKKGSTCITDEDVNKIIDSMGRPEDFDDDEAKVHSQLGSESSNDYQKTYTNDQQRTGQSKRLYRDENNKVIAGVCSGVANYFGIDPVIVRIIVILTLGVTLLPYLILWVAVPSSASTVIGSQRKRLFRDPDNKIIAGVCSGLASYFAINVWIPRVLFLLPFLSFVFRNHHWGIWNFPNIISFSFSPTSIFVYIILWLVIPEAKSAADKLEMKGEKVDLNNIKTTIQGDIEGFKERAEKFGTEMKERAQDFGNNFSQKGKQFATEAEPVIRRSRRGLGDIIVLLAKIFAYFILGCILFSIVVSLFSIGVVFTGMLPAKEYIIRDGWQSFFAWGTLILFIWVPVVGIITWIIRRLTKKRGNSGVLRFAFTSLWLAGVICLAGLIISLRNDFRYKNNPIEQNIPLTNPRVNKLELKIQSFGKYYNRPWLRLEPFATLDSDTVFARNIRVRIVKSAKDSFEVSMVKLTNGKTRREAEDFASKINYDIHQSDSVLLLDRGIAITPNEKFRNQQVIITVAVPVGKRIKINENVGWGRDVNLEFGRNTYWDWENDMESESLNWRHNVEYEMTEKGLKRVDRGRDDDDNYDENDSRKTIDRFRKSKEEMEREKEEKLRELQEIEKELELSIDSTGGYRYQPTAPATPTPTEKKAKVTVSNDVPTGISDLLMVRFGI